MENQKPGSRDPNNHHKVCIRGLDLAAVLRALYSRARPKGGGRQNTQGDVTLEEARECIEKEGRGVGYWKGRAIKVSWTDDRCWINLEGFHEYNGIDEGVYAIEEVINGWDRIVWSMTVLPK